MDQIQSISTLDWMIIAVVVLSTLLSLKRGFVKEVMSLVTWVVAFIIAVKFTSPLQTLLIDQVQNDQIRYVVAFIALFIATLVLGALVNFVLGSLVQATGLSSTDRIIGMLFGFVRGGLIVVAFISLLSLSPAIEKSDMWKSSQLVPQLVVLKDWVREMLGKGGEVFDSSLIERTLTS
ncbi:CvpA family protein [Marinomonas communis]|uniref:Membrane protein required for colicin V production n=1 Tax=Marinomonas communis TaxID=28254 RepID=A0A4R6X7W1_9GAMM|nr:CvpA family protein [Marinomonas communis]MCC4274684.1 CvpA family protein [Marinomonas communis]MEC8080551.1 CvpA family protein [Pseudomonadota bacterium]RUM55530.1 MAG: CvpA family protein [Marinomonas sp.]TDR15165.1 membrane protein required for colicin V production [Marinomonas communis]|tara:strand:+ start:310 stop:843 length:534 start_codon:yes stop_codon:yes gene_type:complete